ncbi:peptide ABC transporter substrate-binding protein [Jeotgalibacillus proteolyticus]|uniref:Oligopeptide ABC transporter substrate-binding protein n=1 Tax=Jeotgalibacillus proteolyticus TaxID=2082395 RepID=A0A2S5G9X8_9BACL|nr:peptide ABC transporter substrate-binding protein [Jeotgalibacillus proteolyticus]PPA69827.1 oligopeptide ABC transporter substrate-binding protein [Jeotgalibacillus proteolyticus]
MKKWGIFLFSIMLVLVLAACTANEEAGEDPENSDDENQEESSGEKVLRMNNGTEPTSLDPSIGFDAASWNVLNNLMEGLTRLGEDHQPQEAVAESWEVSEDGLTYTFHIREDANWSNGDPVTAEDFVYGWTYMLDPSTASSAAFLAYFIEGAEDFNSGSGDAEALGLEAIDEKTFEVTLNAPTGAFLNIISNPSFFPVNVSAAEENPQWYAEADSFVSNGPFMLESWEHSSELVMVKNQEYWDADTVKLDKVHWAMVDDVNTEYQMFESGDLDISEIPADVADQLIDGDNVVMEDQAGLAFYRFNVTEEPFQNEKIRKAIAMSVNQQEIVDYVTKMGEEPAYGFVAPGFTDADGNDFRETNGDLLEYNPDEAKALLEEGMEEEGYDELPQVTLSYSNTEANRVRAESIQQMINETLDINLELRSSESSVFLDEQRALQHQFTTSSFLHDYADPINALESFITDSSMNRTGWSNAEYDQLIADAKTEADEQARFELLYEAEKLLMDEMPIFPLYFYNQVYLYADDVNNIVRHPVGYVELKWADKQ